MRRSDPHLAAMFGVFGRLSAGQRHARPGAGSAGALAAPPGCATAARSRPGSCASGDDRSCCRGRSESPAHQAGIAISSSFLGQLLVVRRLLRGEYVAAAGRDWQLQRYQVRVRGHLGETPGPAAPSPDGATLAIVSRSGVADAVGGESPQPLDACSSSRARGWHQATEGSMRCGLDSPEPGRPAAASGRR